MATMPLIGREVRDRLQLAIKTYEKKCSQHDERVMSGAFKDQHDNGGSLNPAIILHDDIILCRAALLACYCANESMMLVDSKLFEIIHRLEKA